MAGPNSSFLDPLISPTHQDDGTDLPRRANINYIGFSIADNPTTDSTDITNTGGGGSGSVIALLDHAAFRALPSPPADKTVIHFQSPPGTYVYNSTSGAGFADDDNIILKLNSVSTGAAGRAFNSAGAPIVPTISALRAVVSDQYKQIEVQAYSTLGDLGGGTFDDVTAISTAADDGGAFIRSSTRIFRRRYGARIEAAWWGGAPNATFFHTDGKWYTDNTHTVEADNTVPRIKAARDFAAALTGGASVHLCVGNWYVPVQALEGARGEIILAKSNVNLIGEGDATAIRIGPGWNVVGPSGGYLCFYGRGYDGTGTILPTSTYNGTTLQDIQFSNIAFDANSKFNQWPGSNYGGVAFPQNSAFLVAAGINVGAREVTTMNHAGVFAIALGTYSFPEASRNTYIENCRVLHAGDDPNQGDASWFAGASFSAHYTNLVVDADHANNIAWPSGISTGTAFEFHGSNWTATNLLAIDTQRVINIAADSYRDVENIKITNIVGVNVISGITFYHLAGRHIKNLSIATGNFAHRPGVFPFGEAGIDTALSANLLGFAWDGNGFKQCKFDNLEFILTGSPTSGGNSVGMRLLGNCDDVTITNCRVKGWGFAGIITSPQSRPTTFTMTADHTTGHFTKVAHGLLDDVEVFPSSVGGSLPTRTSGTWPTTEPVYFKKVDADTFQLSDTRGGAAITFTDNGSGTLKLRSCRLRRVWKLDNQVRNSGTYGISIASTGGETIADFESYVAIGNDIVDDLGASLSYGINVAALTDVNSVFEPNYSRGHINGAINFDLGAFAGQLHSYRDRTFHSVTIPQSGIGTTSNASNAGVTMSNSTAATSGAKQQFSPELVGFGNAWNGSASKEFLGTTQFISTNLNAGSDYTARVGIYGDVRVEGGSDHALWRVLRTISTDVTTVDGGSDSGASIGFDAASKALYFSGVAPASAYQELCWDGTNWFFLGPLSADIADSDSTITVATANQFVVPPSTLTNDRTKTLGTSGSPATNEAITIVRRDTTANTLAVVNGGAAGGTLYTFPVSVARQATFIFDGTNWFMASTEALA